MPYANNKGADLPAHPHSLISTFVVHCLDSIISPVSVSEISSLYLATVAAQASFECYLVTNAEDRFSRDEAQIVTDKNEDQPKYDETSNELCHKKTCLWGLRPVKTQTDLLS